MPCLRIVNSNNGFYLLILLSYLFAIIMNNHTCEIIDFISSGSINKTLIYIIKFFKEIEHLPLSDNLVHNLGSRYLR